MDSILSVQNKDFIWDGKKCVKILGTVTQTKSHLQRLGFGKIMCRSSMESQHFNTSSFRDKWHRWKCCWPSKRKHFSSIATVRTRWKVVVWLSGMLLLSAKRRRPLGRPENAIWKTIWRTTQRANKSFWSNGRISSDFTERSITTSSIWQESIPCYLSWLWELIAERIWKGGLLIADSEDLEKLDASEIYPRTINANVVLITQKLDEFRFPAADMVQQTFQ